VELSYAAANNLSFATLQNTAGNFVAPSPRSVTAAAASSVNSMPKDFRVSITNAAGKDSYPISSFTYLLIYQKMDAQKGGHLKQFLGWALTDGQKMAEPLTYAPLPSAILESVKHRVSEIQTN
jgi:phosphate transport system substrate-binding protein